MSRLKSSTPESTSMLHGVAIVANHHTWIMCAIAVWIGCDVLAFNCPVRWGKTWIGGCFVHCCSEPKFLTHLLGLMRRVKFIAPTFRYGDSRTKHFNGKTIVRAMTGLGDRDFMMGKKCEWTASDCCENEQCSFYFCIFGRWALQAFNTCNNVQRVN